MKYFFNNIKNKPWLIFLPVLLYYIKFVLKMHDDSMIGDEGRYFMYAQNLLKGFYSPPPPDIYLWNGPGYPLFLLPFVYLKTPLVVITLTNALLQYLSVVFLFKTLRELVDYKKSLIFSLFWAFTFGAYYYMHAILTESLSYFLVTLFIYFVVKSFKTQNKWFILGAGGTLGYLALTKVIFGYVIGVLVVGSFLFYLINRHKKAYKKILYISLIAIFLTLPYLFYTYQLTGKIFYWSNSGGMSLYWMSTPYENEYGDWNTVNFIANKPAVSVPGHQEFLAQHHQNDLKEIMKYRGVKRDDKFKEYAWKNIYNHPGKYLHNIYFNISRMFFDFPNTYAFQYPSRLVWYSSILFAMILLSWIITILNWKKLDFYIRFLFLFIAIYTGGTMLLSMDFRLFSVMIPVILVWVAYIMDKAVSIRLKF